MDNKVNNKTKLITKQQKLGQYFTKNNELKEKVYSFIKNKPKIILEPSIGRGDLIDFIKLKNENYEFHMYEIDNTINFLESINKENIIFGDFLEKNIEIKYNTIIGNPPYVKKYNNKKTKNKGSTINNNQNNIISTSGNLYLKFIN
jgi:hypothetical protein